MQAGDILTLQVFGEEHWKPPSPLHGSLKDIFTGTFDAFVKDVDAVTYAVGGIVSAKSRYRISLFYQTLTSTVGETS